LQQNFRTPSQMIRRFAIYFLSQRPNLYGLADKK